MYIARDDESQVALSNPPDDDQPCDLCDLRVISYLYDPFDLSADDLKNQVALYTWLDERSMIRVILQVCLVVICVTRAVCTRVSMCDVYAPFHNAHRFLGRTYDPNHEYSKPRSTSCDTSMTRTRHLPRDR